MNRIVNNFKIICSECGSENVSILANISYDMDETPFTDGNYIQCNNCSNHAEI